MAYTTGNMMNPFYAAHSTSLSVLSEHDRNVLSSRWSRGIDWNIGKVGKRHWRLMGTQFEAWPLYKTKTAAYEAMTAIILAESRWRSKLRWDAEHTEAA